MFQRLIGDFRTRSDEAQKSRLTLLRDLRKERLAKLRNGELLWRLEDASAPKIVLHILPFSVSDEERRFTLEPLSIHQNGGLLEPLRLYSGGYNFPKYNFDGLISHLPDAYVHVFPDGSIEAVDTSILSASRDYRITSGDIYEKRLLSALRRFLQAQQQIGVEPPLLIAISFLGVEDYTITFENRRRNWMILPEDHRIDRSELLLPEITIEMFDCDLIERMQPAFDAIAHAAHWPKSQIGDEERRSWSMNP